VAKRETVQPRLFEDKVQPKQKWTYLINRKEIDQKARSMIMQGRATYSKTYNSITCYLCGNTSSRILEIQNSYCMSCDVLHDEDYVENQ
jgi:hypothetical protein